ncbi:uncharacterized protein LOC143602693 [Bidens hawaiensis]|uniref:uncharacterized protein LOC143602693 n=1 Tax=Bidens hawaiensis TaxID=980011 RepID=UPI00404A3F26
MAPLIATAQVPAIQAPPTNQAAPTPQGPNIRAFMMNVNQAQSSSDVDHFALSPWKRMVRFGKKGKSSSRFVGPFEIIERIGSVAYRLDLPSELSNILLVFHVSNLKKCLTKGNFQIPLDEVRIEETMHFVERPVEIMYHKDKVTKRSRIPLVKVRWESKQGVEFTWEPEDQIKEKYPHLFTTAIL